MGAFFCYIVRTSKFRPSPLRGLSSHPLQAPTPPPLMVGRLGRAVCAPPLRLSRVAGLLRERHGRRATHRRAAGRGGRRRRRRRPRRERRWWRVWRRAGAAGTKSYKSITLKKNAFMSKKAKRVKRSIDYAQAHFNVQSPSARARRSARLQTWRMQTWVRASMSLVTHRMIRHDHAPEHAPRPSMRQPWRRLDWPGVCNGARLSVRVSASHAPRSGALW